MLHLQTPTYSLHPQGAPRAAYAKAVSRLANDILARGAPLRPLLAEYGTFIADTGREARRSDDEYLLEALLLGVLWRARGQEATAVAQGCGDVLRILATERRAGCGRRRDGSNAVLLLLDGPTEPPTSDPSLEDLEVLLEWLLASGEYDDELARLRGWRDFLALTPARAPEILRNLVAFAVTFEGISLAALETFTARVDHFLHHVLPRRGAAEDTVQCSRTRIEYHFNMVGAEILNRAWREEFLACRRHVVVLPGCARRHDGSRCRANGSRSEIRCRHCSTDCSVSTATRAAAHHGAQTLAVVHGSDFSRFLSSPTLSGGDVGIVGVACVSGLVGAGWRARAQGLPAQCVLLNASGCKHWSLLPTPTSLDLDQLDHILRRDHEREESPLQALAARA
jgi:uncharacterized protein